jgi:hypothetical protein
MNQRVAPLLAIALASLGLASCQRSAETTVGTAAGESQPPAESQPDSTLPGVTIDESTGKRLGLEFAEVTSSSSAAVTRGTAIVLDTAALTTVLADLEAARTDASTARDSYERLQKLYADDGNASRQAVEVASAQWATARAHVASVEARVRSEWGPQLVDALRSQQSLLRGIEDGRTLLLRAEFLGALPAAAEKLEYALLGSDPDDPAAQTVDFLGRSRSPVQATNGPSVLLRLRLAPASDPGFRPGERLPVVAASQSGPSRPLVPAAAVFADGGLFWCYVERPAGRFDRVQLASVERVAGGYPGSEGIKAGDRVVVRGAPLLLSLERGSGSVADEG